MSLAQVKANSKTAPYSTALGLAKEYSKKLTKSTDAKEFAEEELWSNYTKFLEEMRAYEAPEFEAKTYTTNHKFTREVYSYLISYLAKNKDKLNNRRNQLLNGILNEMIRIHRAHGGEQPEIYRASIMFLLSWCDQYPRAIATDDEEYLEMIKRSTLPLVERAIDALSEPIEAEKVNQLAWDLIKTWRQFFIGYLDPTTAIADSSQELGKSLPLPEETKKKLASVITKSLEDELKPKKAK